MPWQDRLREAAYTGPSGIRLRFDYEDVSRSYEARGTAFDFPGVNESYVQRTGFGSRKYPLRCIFWGDDHDLAATRFEALLLEDGVGKLEHPLYGAVDVVPFGTITRNDALKTAANQTIIEVEFWSTLRAIYPEARADPQNEILALLDTFNAATAQQFADSMDLKSALSKARSKATIRNLLQGISSGLEGISDTVTSINSAMRSVQRDINFGMDVLIGQPLLLAQQIVNLTTLPARAVAGIESRLEAYAALADRIFESAAGSPAERIATGTSLLQRRTTIANDFHASDLGVMAAVSGAVLAAASTPVDVTGTPVFDSPVFSTKPQAIAAAELISELADSTVIWRDDCFDALSTIPAIGASQVDLGGSYQAMQDVVALVTGFLVQVSFQVIPERRLVLDRARTIVDVAAELYGSVDDRLDFLISSNDLTGSEILELPAGKVVKYYSAAA
jgi:hypothetical protein